MKPDSDTVIAPAALEEEIAPPSPEVALFAAKTELLLTSTLPAVDTAPPDSEAEFFAKVELEIKIVLDSPVPTIAPPFPPALLSPNPESVTVIVLEVPLAETAPPFPVRAPSPTPFTASFFTKVV